MITIVILIVIAVVSYKLGKTREFNRSERLKKERSLQLAKAKIALIQLRKLRCMPTATNTELQSVDNYNDLIGLWKENRSKNVLSKIHTTPEEVSQLTKEYWLKFKWNGVMKSLYTTDHSIEGFEYYLKERSELLSKHGKTLSDFGIYSDDTIELRKAFYARHAKQKIGEALESIDTTQGILTSLKKVDQPILSSTDYDFGLNTVKQNLAQVLK